MSHLILEHDINYEMVETARLVKEAQESDKSDVRRARNTRLVWPKEEATKLIILRELIEELFPVVNSIHELGPDKEEEFIYEAQKLACQNLRTGHSNKPQISPRTARACANVLLYHKNMPGIVTVAIVPPAEKEEWEERHQEFEYLNDVAKEEQSNQLIEDDGWAYGPEEWHNLQT